MTTLWTGADVLAAIGGVGSDDWDATGVSIDSRTTQPGDLFLALSHLLDGHDHVAEAFAKGAVAAVVSHAPKNTATNARLITVSDVSVALRNLAMAGRYRSQARIVAVTGSVGKGSTVGMLQVMLSGQGDCHVCDSQSLNTWDVALSLATLPEAADYAVIKIGARHQGDIAKLAKLVQPHVAIITRIGSAHLAAFGTSAAIATEKADLYQGMTAQGCAIFPEDGPHSEILRAKAGTAKMMSFGETGDWRLKQVRLGHATTIIMAQGAGQDYLFKLAVPGRHFAMNALAALAGVAAIGADPVTATMDLLEWKPARGRGASEQIRLDPANDSEVLTLVDEATSANPTSLAAAFEVIAAYDPIDNVGRLVKGRRVAFLADMSGLGDAAPSLHANLATNCHLQKIDQIHCAGPLMYHLWRGLPAHQRGQWVETSADIARQVSRLVDAGDVVLVKGGSGSNIVLVVDAIHKLGHRRPLEE